MLLAQVVGPRLVAQQALLGDATLSRGAVRGGGHCCLIRGVFPVNEAIELDNHLRDLQQTHPNCSGKLPSTWYPGGQEAGASLSLHVDVGRAVQVGRGFHAGQGGWEGTGRDRGLPGTKATPLPSLGFGLCFLGTEGAMGPGQAGSYAAGTEHGAPWQSCPSLNRPGVETGMPQVAPCLPA